MKARTFLMALPLISCFAFPVVCAEGQDVPDDKANLRAPVDTLGLWKVWDDARTELVTFGSYQRREDSTGPLIRVYNPLSGERRSIDVFTDFPNASFIGVDGFAVAPTAPYSWHAQLVELLQNVFCYMTRIRLSSEI